MRVEPYGSGQQDGNPCLAVSRLPRSRGTRGASASLPVSDLLRRVLSDCKTGGRPLRPPAGRHRPDRGGCSPTSRAGNQGCADPGRFDGFDIRFTTS